MTELIDPPWERQPGETRAAYEGFRAYRDLGPTRSLTRAAYTLDKHRQTLGQHSTKYRWVERAAAWDDHLDTLRRNALEDHAVTMAERQANLGREMQELARRELSLYLLKERVRQNDLEAALQSGDPIPSHLMDPVVPARTLSAIARAGVEIERVAVGADTGSIRAAAQDLADGDIFTELEAVLLELDPTDKARLAPIFVE